MAPIEEERMQIEKNATEPNDSDSSSDDGVSSDEEASAPIEWLATARARRSTAGNRMKSMIAAEEPDDELELLFAEDEDDAGFTEVEDDVSDVQMDSSSDEEDAQENGDELEGEKELEKKARESRQAARKRKAQEAIPIKFRKKVKINTTAAADTGASTPAEPQSRPKKKSERTSWLPSPADMPTRASKRGTTMLSKEQLHRQMIEREVKRLKQVEAMERKAKKMEALKKPPMTQAERLVEAAIIEKKNAKSLNRWEEAEKQREEERRAKLAALNNRTLDGPVVTFWSGVGEWIDGKLRHVGKIVTIEDKPVKKKRASNFAHEQTDENLKNENDPKPKESVQGETNTTPAQPSPVTMKTAMEGLLPKPGTPTEKPSVVEGVGGRLIEMSKSDPEKTVASQPEPSPATEKTVDTQAATIQQTAPPPRTEATAQPGLQQLAKPPQTKPPQIKPPDIRPPASNTYTTSMFAPPQQTGLMKPPEMKPPTAFLAPPAGVGQGGLSMPRIGYHSAPSKSSNVLAPPSTAQRQSPLSMPQTNAHPPPTPVPTPVPTPDSVFTPETPQPSLQPTALSTQKAPTQKRRQSTAPLGSQKLTQTSASKQQTTAPSPPPSPPANGKATRNCIILQNFNENAIKEKAIQNRILFGQDMSKLAKPSPAPKCVITNHPARYRDPKTGLPYYNSYAYQEIQKLQRGTYKWSRLVGAWVGSGSEAARGVPARFLDPKAPGPPEPKPAEANEGEKGEATESKLAEPSASAPASAPMSISALLATSDTPNSGPVCTPPASTPSNPPSVATPMIAPTAPPSEQKSLPMVSTTETTAPLPMAHSATVANATADGRDHAATTILEPSSTPAAPNPMPVTESLDTATTPIPTQNTGSAVATGIGTAS